MLGYLALVASKGEAMLASPVLATKEPRTHPDLDVGFELWIDHGPEDEVFWSVRIEWVLEIDDLCKDAWFRRGHRTDNLSLTCIRYN